MESLNASTASSAAASAESIISLYVSLSLSLSFSSCSKSARTIRAVMPRCSISLSNAANSALMKSSVSVHPFRWSLPNTASCTFLTRAAASGKSSAYSFIIRWKDSSNPAKSPSSRSAMASSLSPSLYFSQSEAFFLMKEKYASSLPFVSSGFPIIRDRSVSSGALRDRS